MDETTQAEQPIDVDAKAAEAEVEQRIARLFKESKSDHEKRVGRYEKLEQFFIEGKHWENDDDPMLPSIPIGWYYLDSVKAKISKRPFNPRIVAEDSAAWPMQPEKFAMMRSKVAEKIGPRYQERGDTEAQADFLQAVADFYLEKTHTLTQIRRSARGLAVNLGVSFVHNGFDQERELFDQCSYFNRVIHPKDLIADTEGTVWNGNDFDGRFVFIRVPMVWKEVKQRWPDKTKDVSAPTKKADGTAFKSEADRENRMVDIWLVYLRDHTKEKRVIQSVEEIQTGVDMMGNPVMVQMPVTEEIELPKYPGGWVEAYWMEDKLLQYGENTNPSKKLPVHRYACYDEGDIYAHGLGEKIKSINFQSDRFMKFILDNGAATGQNFIIEKQGAVLNPKVLEENDIARRVEVENVGDVQIVQGIAPSEGLFRTHDLLQGQGDLVTSVMDLRQSTNMPTNASGRYVDGVEAVAEARISEIAKNEQECFKSLIRDMCQAIIATDDQERAYKVNVLGKNAELNYAATDLDHDVDFEIPWDVAVDGAAQEASDPAQRNKERFELIKALAMEPPPVAFGILKHLDRPDKESIKATLEEIHEAQNQAAKQAKESGQLSPDEAKAASQNAQDVSQAFQKISDNMPQAPALAATLQLAAVPMIQAIGKGQQLQIDQLLAEAQRILPVVASLFEMAQPVVVNTEAVDPNVDPNAPPVENFTPEIPPMPGQDFGNPGPVM